MRNKLFVKGYNKMAQTGKPSPLWAAVLALGSGAAQAAYKLNMQEPATKLGEEVYFLHNMMTAVCAVIFVAVFAVMFYSL
ncbi:MAG: hypothetical protein JNJ60_13170, partial [Rhodocyclaceae bacterium]|nr:hypothetical protein [Rhodocyclaceae bacterium]